MELILLAGLAAVCGGLAILLWTKLGQATDAGKTALERAEKAEAEAQKQAARADSMKRKLEVAGEEKATAAKSSEKASARVKSLRDEMNAIMQ